MIPILTIEQQCSSNNSFEIEIHKFDLNTTLNSMIQRTTLLLACCIILCSHDMFLKMDSFFLEPGEQATIWLYNGTFLKSENVISRDRMQDVSILSPDGRQRQSEDQWREKGNVTILNFETGKSGTYIAGVSTRPRIIELSARTSMITSGMMEFWIFLISGKRKDNWIRKQVKDTRNMSKLYYRSVIRKRMIII